MTDYDLIIRKGTVVDGTGNEPYQADLGIKDGVISTIGKIAADASEVLNAEGQVVTPGFVDVHTHYDGQATWDNHLNPSSSLGTTTVVMGNCGVGFAPCRPEDREVLVQLMEGVEEIPGTALAEGLPWDWESFPEYLKSLDGRSRDIDLAALLPHGPLRVYVMGKRGVNREAATEEDIVAMQALTKEALAAGAVGISTSRTLVHRSSTGEFIPSYQADRDELRALGQMLEGDKGHVFQLISDWEEPEPEFALLRETAGSTGAKCTFTLLALNNDSTDDASWRQHLRRIETAQEQGLDIRGQVLSRPVGMIMGHTTSMNAFSSRPTLRSLAELSHAERMRRLADPAVKRQVLSEDNINPHVFVTFFGKRFDNMYLMEEPINYLPSRDRSVAARAAIDQRDPEEWLYDYLLEDEGSRMVYIPAINFSPHIPELLRHEHTVVALGDGGAHVGTICDASANIYVLTKWVKDEKVISLPEAVHLLTRQPAELYSLRDRGLLAEGLLADINIIDLEQLALCTPYITRDLPAGGSRLLQQAKGMSATIKSGKVIYRNGKATGCLPGRLLRGCRPDPR